MKLLTFFLRWILLVISIVVASYLTQKIGLSFDVDYSTIDSVGKLFLGTAFLALINGTIGRILKWITGPISCLTFGFSALAVNASILFWVSSFGYGFIVGDFLSALVGSLVLSLIFSVLETLFIWEK